MFLGSCGGFYACSPRIRLASWMSFGMMVTLLAWMAQRLESSNSPTKYASAASCSALIAAMLETEICFEVLRDLPHQPLEG